MKLIGRLLCIFIISAMLFSLAGCTQNTPFRTDATIKSIDNFRDIPNITSQEIETIEAILASRDSFSYGMMPSAECFYTESGALQGSAVLICSWLSDLFGVPFEPVLLEWDRLLTGLESQRIDFSADIPTKWQNENGYYITDAISERGMRLFIGPNVNMNPKPEDKPLRYGYLDRCGMKEEIAAYFGAENVVSVPNLETANIMLLSQSLDAVVCEEVSESVLTASSSAETIPTLSYSMVSIATCNPDLQPLLSAIQKYLQASGGYEISRIKKEGNYLYLREKLLEALTDEEKAYLELHQNPAAVIPIGVDYDNYPFSFYNAQESEWQGLAVDLLDEISRLTGMHFGVVNSRETSWATLLEMLEEGTISMTSEMIRTPERERKFLWTDAPYLTDHYGLLSLSDHPDLNVSQIAYSRVGLIANSAYAEVFYEMYPNHTNAVIYETTPDAFDGLERGDVDVLMMTRNLLLSATNYLERTGIRENLMFNRRCEAYFGFNLNQPVLCSIIGKSQRFIALEDVTDTWTRKVFDYRGKMARAQVPYLVATAATLLSALILLAFFLFKNRQIAKHLKIRTIELEEQMKIVEFASRAKSDFLANMSHEIRTPINTIVGMAVVGKDAELLEKKNHSFEKITHATTHLLRLINDLLDMSKIEANRMELYENLFNLTETVQRVIEPIHAIAARKGVSLYTTSDEGLPTNLIGDEKRLSQVMTILLDNAVKFTPKGGGVHFTISLDEKTEGHCVLRIEVTDTGIGISQEQQANLFTAFSQADTSSSREFGGIGLGLALAKRIVDLMNGNISLVSVFGQGSTFTVTVGMSSADESEALSVVGSKSDDTDFGGELQDGEFETRRALLVDDVDMNREIIMALLESSGLQFETAENGQEAVDMFAQAPDHYDMIFMDIQMPVLDGYEATRAIRAMDFPKAKTIPIIAISANSFKEDVDKSISSGMNAHVGKPVDVQVLVAVMRGLLNIYK